MDILTTIKEYIGVNPAELDYDNEIITYANIALHELFMGGAVDTELTISPGNTEINITHNQSSYICVYTKILFDPPTQSSVMSALISVRDKLLYTMAAESLIKGGNTR